MLNCFRRFLPSAARTQTPLNELLRNNTKGKSPLLWTPLAEQAFQKSKEEMSEATLLYHSETDATLALVCDVSGHSIGAALQRVQGTWEPLAFFSK